MHIYIYIYIYIHIHIYILCRKSCPRVCGTGARSCPKPRQPCCQPPASAMTSSSCSCTSPPNSAFMVPAVASGCPCIPRTKSAPNSVVPAVAVAVSVAAVATSSVRACVAAATLPFQPLGLIPAPDAIGCHDRENDSIRVVCGWGRGGGGEGKGMQKWDRSKRRRGETHTQHTDAHECVYVYVCVCISTHTHVLLCTYIRMYTYILYTHM